MKQLNSVDGLVDELSVVLDKFTDKAFLTFH